ncbi:MAG: hypothetical protein LBS75_04780 [Synergistaceae bacterium]|jgi:hypothetical protein|nr:hypothetical protein [Synergistaceae bacterium]
MSDSYTRFDNNSIEIFYPRMVKNGIIIVHDYTTTLGAGLAVDELQHELGFAAVPLGDMLSIVIVKT